MNKFLESYYANETKNTLEEMDFEHLLNVANYTGLFDRVLDSTPTKDTVKAVKDGNEYNVYCNKLRVHFIKSDSLFGVELFIAANPWDEVNIKNEEFRVFAKCSQILFTGNVKSDSRYVKGSWNRYVMITFNKIVNTILDGHESTEFEEMFKNEA